RIHQEMISAVVAGLEVLFQLQLVKHGPTVGAFGPKTLRHVVAASVAAEGWVVENAPESASEWIAVARRLAPHHRDDNHLLNARAAKGPGAFMAGRSGGENIIDEDHATCRMVGKCASGGSEHEGSTEVLEPLVSCQFGLAAGGTPTEQGMS